MVTVDSPRAEFGEAPDALDYPGAYTLDLARYELGNAVLGQLRTHGTLSEDEAEELATASSFILLNMTVLTVDDKPGVLRLTLATEDARLAHAANDTGTPTTNLAELP